MLGSSANPQLLISLETAFRSVKNARRNHNSTSTADVIVPFAAKSGFASSPYQVVR